jgi:KAP family P-loop domain
VRALNEVNVTIVSYIRSWWGRVWRKDNGAEREGAFAADLPIQHSTEDLLNRGAFARALAVVLYRHRGIDSLVVALRGDWGSGKTSIKNLVVEALTPPNAPRMKVVTFNPWQWGSDDAITRAFFREIAATLGDVEQSLPARRRAHEFRRYAKMLEQFSGGTKEAGNRLFGVITWLGGFGLILAGGIITLDLPAKWLAFSLTVLGGLTLVLSKLFAFIWRDRKDSRPLDIARAVLEDRLRSLPRNILVVIDDIDRLESDQIRTVIRHVKANANFSGLTYLLLYQRDIVEKAFDGGSPGEGRKYLEKIVQAAFDVPVVEEARIGGIVLAELEKISAPLPKDPSFDQTRWGNIWHGGLKHLFRNLRDAKRFTGGVEVQFALQLGSRVLETNLIDTVALEALRIFEPDVYAAVGRNKTLITGSRNRRDTDKEKVKALLADATNENEQAVQYIASQLFPVVAWAFGSPWYGSDFEEGWASERRICSERYFDRYFTLRLPDGRISDSEFLGFIEISGDRTVIDAAFADIQQRGLLPEMLDRLDQAAIAGKLPLEHIDTLLPALFDIAEPLPNQMGLGRQMPFISCWRSASWYLKLERGQETRGQIFLRALKGARGLAVPGTLIGLDIDRRSKGDRELMLTDEQFDSAKATWVEKLNVALNEDSETIIRGEHIIGFLHRWREFEGSDAPRAWVASVAAQPRLLPIFLQAFVHEGEAHTFGDFVSHKMISFQLNALLPFADLKQLIEAVRALPAEIDPAQRAACDRFIEAADRHLAKQGNANDLSAPMPGKSGSSDSVVVDED